MVYAKPFGLTCFICASILQVSPDEARKKEQQNKLREKFGLAASDEEKVSPETFKFVSTGYKLYWEHSHKFLGMREDMRVNRIVFNVEQEINLQKLFDKWFKNAQFSCLFRDFGEGDFEKWRTNAQQFLHHSKVKLAGKLALSCA